MLITDSLPRIRGVVYSVLHSVLGIRPRPYATNTLNVSISRPTPVYTLNEFREQFRVSFEPYIIGKLLAETSYLYLTGTYSNCMQSQVGVNLVLD